MPIEVATFISQLVSTNPQGLDDRSMGDDHLRLIKQALQNTFPDADRAIYLKNLIDNKTAGYMVTTADQKKLITVDATAGPVAIVLPSIAVAGNGFSVEVMKIDASTNTVDVLGSGAETVNGNALWSLATRYESVKVWSPGIGSDWRGLGVNANSITTARIAAGAVTVSRLADASVSTPKIVDLAVTTPKIADGAITAAKTSGFAKLLGTASNFNSAYASSAVQIPPDDSIPQQSTDGTQYASITYTPVSATSNIAIRYWAQLYAPNGFSFIMAIALFKNAVEDAIDAAMSGNPAIAVAFYSIASDYIEPSGSLTARTYKAKWGPTTPSAAGYINGDNTGRKFGGVMRSGMILQEWGA